MYIALLRGINVGGNNLIKMPQLKACFESMGFTNVRTYIQSGNVIFEAPERDAALLTKKIEKNLSETFDYIPTVVVCSQDQLQAIIKQAPQGFGASQDYKYNVLFLKAPLTSTEAIKTVTAREGVDVATTGPGVLYFSTLKAEATKSHLPRIVGTPMYKNITIRNWNTTTKLWRLLDS